MSKHAKSKAKQTKKTGGDRVVAAKNRAIESTLAKLLRISDKIIARQKRAKRRGKRLAKDHRVLKSRLDDVETEVGDQLQRIRGLAAKNATLRERLETQAGMTKDNCAQLSEFEPRLAENQQRSQQLGHQIAGLIQLTEKIRGRSETLEHGLISLEGRVDRQAEIADAGDRSAEQNEGLEKLQRRLELLEDNCTDLEEGNRRLALSIDDLSAREQKLDEQNRRAAERNETLENGRLDQHSKIENQGQRIDSLGDLINDLRSRVEKLTAGLEQTRSRGEQSGELQRRLEQRVDGLQRDLGERQPQHLQALNQLNDTMQQQLQEAGDRERLLQQQVDHLGGLLVTTEGQLKEQSAQLALEDARLAERAQLLEQRLAEFEATVQERQAQALAPLGEQADVMQQQLQEVGEREQSLRQQLDDLAGLLVTTEGQLSEKSTQLALEDARLAEQAQLLEQRLAELEGAVSGRQAEELASLRALGDAAQQQLRQAGDREESLRQQIDDLDGLLESSAGQLSEQTTKLTEKTDHLASGQQALKTGQRRLFGGLLAAGLMVLVLGFAGYGLIGKRLAKNQAASFDLMDEIKQQVLRHEQVLSEQQKPPEAAGQAQIAGPQISALETRLVEQEKLFTLLEGQRRKQTQSIQGALEKLRQGFAQQKRLISLQRDDTEQLRGVLQQLEAAQQKTDVLLQRLAAEQSQQHVASERLQADLKLVKGLQAQAEVRAITAAPEQRVRALRGDAWLRQLDPRQYIIQLVAAHNKAVIEQAAADAGRPDGLAYYKGQYQGRDWYVLLYGQFSSTQQALTAISELPEPIRAFKPWIRRISTVHRELADRP